MERVLNEIVSNESLFSVLFVENIKTSQDSYESAWTACEILPSTHPAKLGLALNYSVFHYEILEDKNKACNIAKAVSTIHSLQIASSIRPLSLSLSLDGTT